MSTHAQPPVAERTTVRRERYYSNMHDLSVLLEMLRESHSTGELSIHFSQGGISAVTFSEQQHISVPK
jgi:hypothetical protein